MARLTKEEWQTYAEQGFLHLGKVLSDSELAGLQQRIDEIMLGTAPLDYDQMLMQLDSMTGEHKDLGKQTMGHKGATRNYRKIQNLELDPLYLAYIQSPLMREICESIYGKETSISIFRAMFMNKPAGHGTFLPWHQDRWSDLDQDPLITVWTALDPATKANGCVQILPGSHKDGLLNPDHPSGFVSEEQADVVLKDAQPIFLELEAGEAALLHNWTLHSSDTNTTEISRRALSVCYMDGSTRSRSGQTFPTIFEST